MKKPLRYVVLAIVVLLVICLALPFFIDANQFRPTVETELSTTLHRQVKIGNLKFSLFSGSLTADNLAVADDPAFSQSPFLTAQSFRVGVELVPLIFSKTLHVTGLTIEKPSATLLRNPAGKWNYSSLAAAGSSNGGGGGSSPDLAIKKLEIKDGRVAVGSTTSPTQAVYDPVNLEATDVALNAPFPVRLSATLPAGGSLKLEGKAGPLDRADTSLTPVNAKLTINGLDLAKTGFLDPASGIAGTVDVNCDIASANGQAKLKGTKTLQKLQLVKGGSPAGTPISIDFDTTYDLRRNAGTLNQATVKVGSAVATLSGTFETQANSILLNLKLNAQSMPVKDIQSVLPAVGITLPKGASLQQGTLNANLNSSGAVDKLITAGDVGLFNAVLSGFDLGSQLSSFSAFTGVKSGNGTTAIEKLTTNLRAAPEGMQFTSLLMVLPGIGQVTGNGTISNPGNVLNFKMVATLSNTGGVLNVVGGATGKKSEQIPFAIQGTTSDPKFVPNITGAAGSMIGSQVENILGGSKSKGQSSGGVEGAIGGLFGKKSK